mmetsp:Transcript_18853/g.29472  ORF Transcript_18853/g.29472 Transcript_18853/m.29472 type:complete len:205 (-) Transcript_18853:80-694(-)
MCCSSCSLLSSSLAQSYWPWASFWIDCSSDSRWFICTNCDAFLLTSNSNSILFSRSSWSRCRVSRSHSSGKSSLLSGSGLGSASSVSSVVANGSRFTTVLLGSAVLSSDGYRRRLKSLCSSSECGESANSFLMSFSACLSLFKTVSYSTLKASSSSLNWLRAMVAASQSASAISTCLISFWMWKCASSSLTTESSSNVICNSSS